MMVANKKVFYFIMSLLAVVFVLAACGTKNEDSQTEKDTSDESTETIPNNPKQQIMHWM